MTKEAYPMALVTQDSLDSYIRSVNSYPMLTADEERELAERLHYKGEIEAAKGLILSHLRFVVHVARGYSGYGLPMADLVQEGNIGLMKAVKRFNPEVGVRLVSLLFTGSKQRSMSTYYVTGVSLKLQQLKRSVNCSSIYANRKTLRLV